MCLSVFNNGAVFVLTLPCAVLLLWFSGETEEEFEELLDFIEEAQLDRVGAFNIPGGRGCGKRVARSHRSRCAGRSSRAVDVSARRNQRGKTRQKVGKTMQVLVDDVDEEGSVARSAADAPEIDGLVYIMAKNWKWASLLQCASQIRMSMICGPKWFR